MPNGLIADEDEDLSDPMLNMGNPIVEDIIRRAQDDGLLRREV